MRLLSDGRAGASVAFDDLAVLKLLRRADPGDDPELEANLHLCQVGCAAVPRFLGALRLEGTASSTLALVRAFVPIESDGWENALKAFRVPQQDDPILQEDAWEQGRRVGELHRALSQAGGGAAFAPERILREDLERWSASMIGRLGVTLAAASSVRQGLGDLQEPLIARGLRLARLKPSGWKIRVHGNLHLRQLLRGKGGWQIVDVESAHDRTATQRREKQPPLRDLAALLQSYEEAAVAAGLEDGDRKRRLAAVRRALMEGYRSAITGAELLPEDADTSASLLEALELEEAVRRLSRAVEQSSEHVTSAARTLYDLSASSPATISVTDGG